MSTVHIFGGGTFSPIRNHLALAAIAFGTTATRLKQLVDYSQLELTKMADPSSKLLTNADVGYRLDIILEDPDTHCIIMNAALCDYKGSIGGVTSGSHAPRLETKVGKRTITITPSSKLISHIRDVRPDVLVVGFKTTTDATGEQQIKKAKRMNVDIVLANDTITRNNIIITRELVISAKSREDALAILAKLVNNRLKTDNPIKSVIRSGKYSTYQVLVPVNTPNPKSFAKVLVPDGSHITSTCWSMYTQNIMEVTVCTDMS